MKEYHQKAADPVTQVIAFMKAQITAENEGKKEFVCPICGGKAYWGRSSYNNHLHSGCRDCRFYMIE